MNTKEKEKQLNKKMIRLGIWFLVSAIFLAFVIFISRWEKTRDGSMGWYFFLAIFFFSICAIRLFLAYAEKQAIKNPNLTMRR